MSKITKKIIIILVFLVFFVGAYIGSVAYRNRQLAMPHTPFTPGARLEGLESSELERIEIPGLALDRKGESWELAYFEGGIPQGIELDQRQIRGMLFPLTNIWIEQTVDEAPEDISIYGLDRPSSHVILTDSAGKTVEYIRGNLTPTMMHYYAMQAGDPAVYTVSSYHGGLMLFTLDSIRARSLFPAIQDAMGLTHFRLERQGAVIEIIAKPESVPPNLTSPFYSHILTSPYLLPRGVSPEPLQNLLMPFSNLMIQDFIDDNPSSLGPYGLDQGMRIFLQTREASIDLLIGNEVDGARYAKLPDRAGVFTLYGMESVINARPFTLIDKFPILIGIDMVDRMTITGGEQPLSADIEGTGQDAVFFLNGNRAEDRSFRTFYQAVIGLLSDAEYSGSPRQATDGSEINIDFQLNTPPGGQVSITLIPYNRDFYALRQEGTMEFLISRNQVRRIFETAGAVISE